MTARGLHPRRAALLRAARAGAWPHGTSRPLACGKGGSFVSTLGRKPAGVREWHVCLRALRRGRVVHSSNSLLPPGRGQSPLPSPLKGALPPRPPKGGRYPPYPPLTGRVRGRTGQAALLPAARAGVEACQLGENTRRCMETHIACAPSGGEELSTLQTRCCPLAPRTGGGIPPTPLLRAGCVAARDKPPSCVPQGRVRGRTGQAAFLPTARAGA